jgi:hypothetical protein
MWRQRPIQNGWRGCDEPEDWAVGRDEEGDCVRDGITVGDIAEIRVLWVNTSFQLLFHLCVLNSRCTRSKC